MIVAMCLLASACSSGQSIEDDRTERPISDLRVAMGSSLGVTVWGQDPSTIRRAIDAVYDEFGRLETQMSVWHVGSDIQRLNSAAGGAEPVRVSPEVLEVLMLARSYSEASGGTFDVTFGPLASLWKFDHDQDDVLPERSAIAARLPLIGWEDLILDPAAGTARLRRFSGLTLCAASAVANSI